MRQERPTPRRSTIRPPDTDPGRSVLGDEPDRTFELSDSAGTRVLTVMSADEARIGVSWRGAGEAFLELGQELGAWSFRALENAGMRRGQWDEITTWLHDAGLLNKQGKTRPTPDYGAALWDLHAREWSALPHRNGAAPSIPSLHATQNARVAHLHA